MNVLLSTYCLHQPWIKKYMEPYIHATHRVVIIPMSFHEDWVFDESSWQEAYGLDGKYHREIAEQFYAYGISPQQLRWLNCFTEPSESMQDAINKADIVFLTGGLPEKAVERIQSFNLASTLRDFSGHIIGASAGALLQLPAYYCSPDDDYPEFSYFSGINLVDKAYYIEVHYTGSDLQKDCIQRALNERTEELYAIGDSGAILLSGKTQINIGDVTYFARD